MVRSDDEGGKERGERGKREEDQDDVCELEQNKNQNREITQKNSAATKKKATGERTTFEGFGARRQKACNEFSFLFFVCFVD
jgi:hypothetical protein